MDKTIKLTSIRLNPDNPRLIRDGKFKKLVESIKRDPEFLEKRGIVHADGVILGGNQRYLAIKEALKDDAFRGGLPKGEIPASWVQDASDWPEEKRRRFVILDNSSFGEMDFDILANLFSDLPLVDLGVDLPEDWLNPGGGDGGQQTGSGNLADRFGVPPFSVLNAREGWWQDRKAAWIALGIKSELGRGGVVNDSGSGDHGKPQFLSEPGGSARPACDYSKNQRGDGRGRPIT